MSDLRKLAEAATPGHDHASALLIGCPQCRYIAAASPDVVLSLLDQVDHQVSIAHEYAEQADALRAVLERLVEIGDPGGRYMEWSAAMEQARAALEAP